MAALRCDTSLLFSRLPVVFPGVIDLLGGMLGFGEALVDRLRCDLGLGKGVYQLFVVEDVACGECTGVVKQGRMD